MSRPADQSWDRRSRPWVEILRCPRCRSEVAATSGGLKCRNCGEVVPENGGVLLLQVGHAFEGHWEGFVEPIAESKRDVAVEFLAPLFERVEPGAYILDAGCGDGVHLAILAEQGFLRVAGLDVSGAALAAAAIRHDQALLLQADMAAIPLADASCDAVFSFGAIAYTDDPPSTIAELARVVRPGGWLGLWIYPQPVGVSGAMLRVVRTVCRWGGRWFTRRVADLIVPLLQWLPTRSRVHLGNASWSQCREVVLVNIAPAQLVFPSRDEVLAWGAQASGSNLRSRIPRRRSRSGFARG